MSLRLGLLGLMLASGFAGLGYQLVWTQQMGLWLGHETAAVLAVVAAFFGGLALGGLVLGQRIERSLQPWRWYVACEAVIGLWALLLGVALHPVGDALLNWIGPDPSALRQWVLAFGGVLACLLPATVAMGATLPAMERARAQAVGGPREVAGLYAANTLGAVLGVLAAAFWLLPALGLGQTERVCAGLNLACAAGGAWLLGRRSAHVAVPPSAGATSPPSSTMRVQRHPEGRWRLACTGLLGIAYEVLVVRVISQVAEDTVYTFALLLAVYLVGTALGAAVWQRWRGAWTGQGCVADAALVRDRLLVALGVAVLLGMAGLYAAPALVDGGRGPGQGMTAALAAEALAALAAFGLPTVVMGALFSHQLEMALAQGQDAGRAVGVNALGAAVAAPLFGVWLTPGLGAKLACLLVAAAYLLLVSPARWRRPWVLGPLLALGATALLAPPLVFVDLPEGGHVLSYDEGVMAAVSVVQDAQGVARLRINNRQQEGSSGTLFVDGRQGLLPLMWHPHPQRALFLGLGTGVTASTVAEDARMQVDVAELLPEVIGASHHFWSVFDREGPSPRLHVHAADARRQVRVGTRLYDLIVADNFHPARSGSGALYTVEHFQAVRERLAPGGLFCQWLPLHQLDLPTLRSIVRSYLAVYPHAIAILASQSLETPVIGLMSRRDGEPWDAADLMASPAALRLPMSPQAFGLGEGLAVLGAVVAGPQALQAWSASAPLNTDDHPVVSHMAPRATYAPQERPAERLLALLEAWSAQPQELLTPDAQAAWGERAQAYWHARNAYLKVGLSVMPTADVQAMLAQVREPLLAVLRLSPDFRPAYEPLVGMASAWATTDAPAARALLSELTRLQPAWPEARLAAEAMGAAP
jgi:spermidine synthase